MREIRTSGSEGGAGREPRSYLYPAGNDGFSHVRNQANREFIISRLAAFA